MTSTAVNRATAQLDKVLSAWQERPLAQFPYLFLDAPNEKVRQDGQIREAAVLLTTNVDLDGNRQVLGVSVSLSEAEIHWRR